MSEINDLQIDLDETIDLSDNINKDLKVSKKSNKNTTDVQKGLPNLNLRKKRLIQLSPLKNILLDTISSRKKEKTIDINNIKKNENITTKIKKTKFKLKNTDFSIPGKNYQTKKIFLVLVFIGFLVICNKILLEINVRNGYQHILNIKSEFSDTKKIKKNIKKSQKNFFWSKLLFSPFSVIPNTTIKNVSHLIDGGSYLSQFLEESMFIYDDIHSLINKNALENINFITFLENIKSRSQNINTLVYNALVEYNNMTSLGNNDLDAKVIKLTSILHQTLKFIDTINKNYDTMISMLGKYSDRKYVIVFQNNDEIRATGGFMGSFSTLTLRDGKIFKVDKKDVYAYEWIINKFYKDKEKAPEGLHTITNTFGLRDANYFPEIKDSAEKIKFFFDKIAYKIDGIIFINQNVVKDMIETIDFVDSESIGQKITKDNFSMIISTLVEAEVTKRGTIGTPKQGLFDFAEEFYAKLLSERKFYDYLKVVSKNIVSRDIVFYSFHPKENSLAWKLGLTGKINFNHTLDFSYPIYTSIGGNKSDRYIRYNYEKTIKKIENCSYKTNLKIKIHNTFSKKDENQINEILDTYKNLGKSREDIVNIQGKGPNKSYLRVLVPKDSLVKIKDNQKIKNFEKYKIVELYTHTKPGGKSVYDIGYTLPNRNCEKYNFTFMKQAGIKSYNIGFLNEKDIKNYENIQTDFVYKKD